MRADQEELAERIARALPRDGSVEPQPGLHFRRRSGPTERVYASAQPFFCVIAQGSKDMRLGEDCLRYDAANCLNSKVELPPVGPVVEASSTQA
ncbi:MAG: AraC family transcriptional regulator [Phycisphaerae bacterium]